MTGARRELRLLSTPAEQLLFDLLADGMSVQIQVTGTSMAPFLRDEDLVTLDPLTSQKVRVGDIVAFQRAGNRLVLHRVVDQAAHRIQTRGDAAAEADEWIARQSLCGRLSHIERHGRRVRLGLGRERALLAWLSSRGLLALTLRPLRWLLRRWALRSGTSKALN